MHFSKSPLPTTFSPLGSYLAPISKLSGYGPVQSPLNHTHTLLKILDKSFLPNIGSLYKNLKKVANNDQLSWVYSYWDRVVGQFAVIRGKWLYKKALILSLKLSNPRPPAASVEQLHREKPRLDCTSPNTRKCCFVYFFSYNSRQGKDQTKKKEKGWIIVLITWIFTGRVKDWTDHDLTRVWAHSILLV